MKTTINGPLSVPLSKLIQRNEAALERWRAIQMIPFQRRAEWLIKQIKKELPNVGAIVSCNGDSWLVPLGYPLERGENEFINFRDNTTGEIYLERVTNALQAVELERNCQPDVSPRCLAHIKELAELATYCCDNLEQIDTSNP